MYEIIKFHAMVYGSFTRKRKSSLSVCFQVFFRFQTTHIFPYFHDTVKVYNTLDPFSHSLIATANKAECVSNYLLFFLYQFFNVVQYLCCCIFSQIIHEKHSLYRFMLHSSMQHHIQHLIFKLDYDIRLPSVVMQKKNIHKFIE